MENKMKKQSKMKLINTKIILTALFILVSAQVAVRAQTTAFTYQGRLTDSSMSANGSYDLGFALYDAATGGNQIGAAQTRANVTIANGIFTVSLDFGAAAFPGANRYLEITVKKSGETNFTTLTPRQQVTSTPYAIRAQNAKSADTAAQLGGTAASQFVQTDDTRLSDARTPTAGSANYIQNQSAATQTPAGFSISGTGGANIFNATTQYNIGDSRVLSIGGSSNLFVGDLAGFANTNGFGNSFVGTSAGQNNTTGFNNSFVGAAAGVFNSSGSENSFVGRSAGGYNRTGGSNSFVGSNAGLFNTSGSDNSFVGKSAGQNNTTGFSGSFVGTNAGFANTTGGNNSFIGTSAGAVNTTGSNNTVIGANANVGSGALTYAAAIGSNAVVRTANTIVLGREDGSDKVRIFGLGAAGSTQLCRNANNEISTCSSSLRYKTNIASFSSGLSFINQLRPISFDWKDGGMKDVGFGAEDVAKINPLFVSFNDKGEVEGVKYDRLSVAFVNAFKEQQTQIETQNVQIEKQQKQIDDLKLIVCAMKPDAEVCRDKK